MPYKEYGKILKIICENVPHERLKQTCLKHGLDYDIAVSLAKDALEFAKLEDKMHVGGENFIEAYIKYEQQEMYCAQSFLENCYSIGILHRFGHQQNRFRLILWSDLCAWCERKYEKRLEFAGKSNTKTDPIEEINEIDLRFDGIL